MLRRGTIYCSFSTRPVYSEDLSHKSKLQVFRKLTLCYDRFKSLSQQRGYYLLREHSSEAQVEILEIWIGSSGHRRSAVFSRKAACVHRCLQISSNVSITVNHRKKKYIRNIYINIILHFFFHEKVTITITHTDLFFSCL